MFSTFTILFGKIRFNLEKNGNTIKTCSAHSSWVLWKNMNMSFEQPKSPIIIC